MSLLCFLLLIASYANGQRDTKSSLTFVIDVTRSMQSVKDQVKAHAHGIFDAVVRSNESDIANFVLVTFADPAVLKTSVNNVTVTKDPNIFKDALSLILVSGKDCPEYSISGIKTGIENSKPGSTIYVFTDASAKDYDTYEHVKDMALKKEIRILFVLTGSCPNSPQKEYDVYNWLAIDTSGQVFNLHKHNVSYILDWIKDSVVSRRILLKAKSFSPGDVLFLNYTTDLATRDTSISLSGCNKSLSVTGPDGKKLKLEDLVHLKNILVVKVNETKPGTHSVAFDCKNKTRLVVTAKSHIQFRHGFSGFVPSNFNDTTVKPSTDGKTYLSIKISGNFRPKTVNFIDGNDTVVSGFSLPLKPLNETDALYVTGPFDTPFIMFRIIVTGLDLDHNATISRIGYTFVEPQNPFLEEIINKKPIIVIERSPKILMDMGSFLQLKCTVNAFPKPSVTWEKDGTILETNVYDYDLPYAYVSVHKMVNITENSTFMCKANNSEGDDKQTMFVEIKPKAVFEVVEKPENVTIKYNDLVHLKCKINAYPHANVTWYKNGVSLSNEDGITDDGSELMIQQMKLVNEGNYSCNIKNQLQEEVISFEIKISGVDPPKILNTSDSLNFKEGTVNTISCRIEKGTPEPAIHWYFDSGLGKYDEIVEAMDEVLIMSNVNRNQAGKYKCVATNELGTDMMEKNVIVEYMPMVDNNTEPIIAKAGEEVTLTCAADGVPKPHVRWTKDDLPLKGSKFTTGDHRLTFGVGLKDAGVYECIASNPHGSKSKTINVEVHNAPRIHIKEKGAIDADIDKPLKITCEVIGFPKPDITWINVTDKRELKTKIEEITPYHFVSRLDVITVSPKSTFQCKANNSLGAREDEIEIIVKTFFKDLQCPEDKTHDIGFNKTALFVCKVDAYPPAQVIWYKNEKVFPKKDLSVSSDGLTLTIKHMQSVDQGRYKCEVKNSIISSECAFAIHMSGVVKPKIFASSRTMNVVENSSAIIHCRLEKGNPKPAIKWYHKNIEIVGVKDREDLSLSNLKRGEQGNYKCIATNLAGNDTMETDIIVEYAPAMMEDDNQTLSFLVDSKIILKCLADGEPKPTITWFKDDSRLNSLEFVTNSNNSLEFYLGLDHRGTYKCIATNYLGTAIKSVILEVDTPPHVSIKGNSKQRLGYGGFLQLKCNVKAHPAPDIRWIDTTSATALYAPTFAKKTPYEYVSILNITRAEKNATYQCRAANMHGDRKTSVIVEVGARTYFNVIDEPRDTIIPYHTQGQLYCNIDAYPPAKITWYKHMKEITSKNGLNVTKDGILTFKNMEPFQRGRYTCEAKSSEITQTFVVKVIISGLEYPKISMTASEKTNHIRNVLVRDVNITLSCKIEKGIPKPAIKWMYKNKHTLKYVEIKDARDMENYSVIVSGDTLHYACEVSNQLGFESLKINLKLPVHQPIKRKGKKRRILVDGAPNALKLECRVKKIKNLPRPKIKWIYQGTEDNPKDELLISEQSDRPRYHTTTFKSYNITYDQRGLYSCIATDRFGIQSLDSFIVDVNTPPEILNTVKVIRAVVNDTALSIHCIATGHPKPKFRWTHGGITEEGETLTLYNITRRHADFDNRTAFFDCEAYNSVNYDNAKFEVIIDDYPSLDNPNSTLKLELGKDVPLICPIPHGDGDRIRWFKNNKKITDGELKIDNAKMSDAGLYTCRVSGATDSSSANVDLKIGSWPVFTNTDVRAKISLGLGEVVALDCSAMGIPNPRVSWFHNGKAVSATAVYHSFKMSKAKSGIYKCEVMNDFDTISRNFYVVLNECLLKIDPNDRRQPLIVTQRFTSPIYKYEDGYLYMPQNQSIILTCGTNRTFNYFAYDYIYAYCNATAGLEIDGDYDFSDLKCNKEVMPYVKWTGRACQGEDSEMIEIGYEVPFRTKTLAVYESCIDILNDVPFYTKQCMRLPIADVIPKVAWFEDRFSDNFKAVYDVDEQIDWISSTLGFWFHKDDRCVFTQRQLVDPQGLFPGIPQGVTFTHLNVVPQWSSCSTKNWDDVESRVRNLLKSTSELTVWTGTADKLTLTDSDINVQEIFLSDPKTRATPTPVSTYLWKVVQNRAEKESLAIILINVPDIKLSDVYKYIKCRDVCNRTNWMNSLELSKTNRGYVFCCTLDEFEYTFGYRGRGIFGRGMDNPLLHV